MKSNQRNNRNQKKKQISPAIHKPAGFPKYLLAGKWRITGLSEWGNEFCGTEVKAHITIKGNGGGFQFGLVCGGMDGEFMNTPFGATFDFTFEGTDECDEVSGDGYLCTIGGKTAEGKIRFHCGGKSGFTAKKKIIAKEKPAAKGGIRK